MQSYYVIIRDKVTENRRELEFQADDFSHVEEQAKPYVETNDQIIEIELDY